MSLPSSASPPPSPAARLMRGYGPLFAFAVLFMLMAALVPTVGHEIKTVAAAGPGAGDTVGDGATAGDGSQAGTDAAASGGAAGGAGGATTGSGPAAARGGSTGATRAGGGPVTASGGGTGAAKAGGGASGGQGRLGNDRRLRQPQGPGTQRPLLAALHRLRGRQRGRHLPGCQRQGDRRGGPPRRSSRLLRRPE